MSVTVNQPQTSDRQAYKNQKFLAAPEARPLRILCEYEESMQRLEKHGVRATIMFFGSARAKSHAQHKLATEAAQKALDNAGDAAAVAAAQGNLTKLKASAWMCDICESVSELAKRFTAWSIDNSVKLDSYHAIEGAARYKHIDPVAEPSKAPPPSTGKQTILVCTGGGPGFMEAANRGAASVPGGKTVGMGITLPFEDGLNPYVTEASCWYDLIRW